MFLRQRYRTPFLQTRYKENGRLALTPLAALCRGATWPPARRPLATAREPAGTDAPRENLRRVTGGLKLKDRERSRFFFFVAVNCLMNVGLTIGLSVSEGLFLSRKDLGPGMLAVVFIITAIATALSTFVYAAYVDKVRNDRYFQILQACAIAVLALILVGLRNDVTAAFMALYGFYYVVSGIFNTHFWNYATDYFDAVEAKRLFPFFPLGNSVGGFCGGVLAGALGTIAGPLGLVGIWIGLLLATTLLIGVVSPRLRGWVISETEEADEASLTNVRQGFRFLLRSAMGRWHVAYALVMITSLFFMQYLYSDVLAKAYPDANRLTAFIGTFLAVTNIVEVILEVTFTPRLIGLAGVGASNVFYPLSTLVGFALLGSLHNVAAAVYSRMNRETFDNAVSGACRNLLYNAYPTRFRGRIRAFIEGAVTNTGIVLTGLTLMGLGRLVPPDRLDRVVTWLGGFSALIFLGVALRIRHEYLNTLVHGLKDYRLDLEDVNLELDKVPEPELLEILQDLEAEDDAASMAIVARILGTLAARGNVHLVAARLACANPQVQLAAIDVLFTGTAPGFRNWDAAGLQAALTRVLENADADPELRARALEALSARQDIASIAAWLEDEAPRVQAAAAASLLQRKGADVDAAWRVIHGMLGNAAPSVRTAALQRLPVQLTACRDLVLAHVQDQHEDVRQAVLNQMAHLDPRSVEVRQQVQPLLEDANSEVRAAVVRFLSRADEPALLVSLASCLNDDAIVVRRAAIEAMRPWGAQVVPHVRPLLDARATHAVSAAMAVLGSVPDAEVRDTLRGWLEQRLVLAHDAVIAQCVLSTATGAANAGLDPLDAQMNGHARITNEPLAMVALRDFVHRMTVRVLDGLERLEDPTVIRNIRRCLETSHRMARGDAMEALSNLRERRLAQGLLVLFDDGTLEERSAASLAWRGLERAPQLDAIMASLQSHGDRWIRVASAILAEQLAPGSGGTDYQRTEEYAVMKHLLFLKKVPLFAQMSLEQLEIISRVVSELSFYNGEVIFRETEMGDKLYVIVEGKVRVVKNHRASSEVTLATLGVTDYFGEMSVLDNEPRSASIVVAEDARLLSISGEKLRDIVQQKPEIAFEIFKVLSSRLRRADQKLSEMAREIQRAGGAAENVRPT